MSKPKPDPAVREYLSAIGRKGGRRRSERKAQAARENAKLGGRKPQPKPGDMPTK